MAKIRIAGPVISNNHKWIYNWFEMDSFCVNDLTKQINNPFEELEIEINSPGGSVFDGSEIYSILKKHQGKVNVHIIGVAASIASVIAMAGDHVAIAPTAEMMIHNVSATGSGDYRDMEHMADVLKKSNSNIANAYVIKTGLSKEEILEMMNKETWITPEEAQEKGFVDEILFLQDRSDLKLVAGIKDYLIPENIIQKMTAQKAKAELEILELKEIKE